MSTLTQDQAAEVIFWALAAAADKGVTDLNVIAHGAARAIRELILECPHDSLSGDPQDDSLWRCDSCNNATPKGVVL